MSHPVYGNNGFVATRVIQCNTSLRKQSMTYNTKYSNLAELR